MRSSIIRKYKNVTRSFSAVTKQGKFVQKYVRVTIIGASSKSGQALTLLLKQNPLISHLAMLDKGSSNGLAADIAHVDTRCEISSYMEKDMQAAIKSADIIVMLGLDSLHRDCTIKDYLREEGPRILTTTTTCSTYAPKAIFIDCVHPVSITLPLVSEIYRKNHWYHPGRVLGSVSLLQIQANTLLARYQNLDPASVHVPLLGGPDEETLVPLFSRSTPSTMPLSDAKILINRFRGLSDDASMDELCKTKHEYCPYSSAFSLNRLITTIALGLLGDNNALTTAYVRSNFVSSCRHIVSTVKFGSTGIVHNYGVPRLTKFEMQLFENATLELKQRERIAKEYLTATGEVSLPPDCSNANELDRILFPRKETKTLRD